MNKPRNERNFWITIEVDGRETPIACGPRGKEGGFTLKVYQRGVPEEVWNVPVLVVSGRENQGFLSLSCDSGKGTETVSATFRNPLKK